MWTAAGLRVAVAGGLAASLARTRRSRCAAALLAVASVPFAQEFFYGNESTWLTLGIALVAWRRDRFWTGVAIGVLAGFFAKPALLPFFLWMLLWRPRALCGAALAGAAVTAVGLAAAGTAGYMAWLGNGFARSDTLGAAFAGNYSLAALLGLPWVWVAAVAFVIAVPLMWRHEVWGFRASIVTGLLTAPYLMPYLLVPLLAALGPPGGVSPEPLPMKGRRPVWSAGARPL